MDVKPHLCNFDTQINTPLTLKAVACVVRNMFAAFPAIFAWILHRCTEGDFLTAVFTLIIHFEVVAIFKIIYTVKYLLFGFKNKKSKLLTIFFQMIMLVQNLNTLNTLIMQVYIKLKQ